MNTQAAYDRIEQSGLMAGMRGHFPPDVALKHVDVLLTAGQIDVFEFTMNSDSPIEAMQATKKRYGNEVCAGMGTVLDAETAKRVLDGFHHRAVVQPRGDCAGAEGRCAGRTGGDHPYRVRRCLGDWR